MAAQNRKHLLSHTQGLPGWQMVLLRQINMGQAGLPNWDLLPLDLPLPPCNEGRTAVADAAEMIQPLLGSSGALRLPARGGQSLPVPF